MNQFIQTEVEERDKEKAASIHEVIVVPKDGHSNSTELLDIVNSVNATEVSPEEVLTGNVYEYDGRAKALTIANDPKYKVNEASIQQAGFKPTKSMVKNMESLNKATGKNNSLKDVKDILKSRETPDHVKGIANDIAKECKFQELQLAEPEV